MTMSIKTILENGQAVIICPDCGQEFTTEYSVNIEDNDFADFFREMLGVCICDACGAKHEEEEKWQRAERRKILLAGTLEERLKNCKMPNKFAGMTEPYNRDKAVWLWKHRNNSVLIGGETGTYKTSSAIYVARKMMETDGISARYYTRKNLVDEYLKAKTSTDKKTDSVERFNRRISQWDILIIDELVGKKGIVRMTPAEQDLFFDLIDGVYSEARKTKIWLIGNFFGGALNVLFDDPQPTKRRLMESFKIAWFDADSRIDENVKL